MVMPMKIAIVVHGRFHAFGLAAALSNLGHEVTLFTNYPRLFADGELPAKIRVVTYWTHFLRSRLRRFRTIAAKVDLDAHYLSSFGAWAERKLREQRWDLVYSWSSVSKEILASPFIRAQRKLVVRGSTHILLQQKILRDESLRTGLPIEQPSSATIERELFEYANADFIVVLSSFCRRSFIDEGVDAARMITMLPACNLKKFGDFAAAVKDRRERIQKSDHLRVVTVGAFSLRKGAFDYCETVEALSRDRFKFRFIGSISEDAVTFHRRLGFKVDWVPRTKQTELRSHFAWGDIFLYPTLEEGFPQVTMQASASGLQILTTRNGGFADLQSLDENCREIPISDAGYTVRLLNELEADRSKILAPEAAIGRPARTWDCAARDLLESISL